MHAALQPRGHQIDRPAYVWAGIAVEIVTAVLAIPVGIMFVTDTSGRSLGIPQGWIEASPFGSYLIPGLYLFAVNGIGMFVLAGLSYARRWIAPWLTGVLGVGMIIWILVQFAIMPETMILQPIFLAVGFALGFVALFWLRRTGQLVLW